MEGVLAASDLARSLRDCYEGLASAGNVNLCFRGASRLTVNARLPCDPAPSRGPLARTDRRAPLNTLPGLRSAPRPHTVLPEVRPYQALLLRGGLGARVARDIGVPLTSPAGAVLLAADVTRPLSVRARRGGEAGLNAPCCPSPRHDAPGAQDVSAISDLAPEDVARAVGFLISRGVAQLVPVLRRKSLLRVRGIHPMSWRCS